MTRASMIQFLMMNCWRLLHFRRMLEMTASDRVEPDCFGLGLDLEPMIVSDVV